MAFKTAYAQCTGSDAVDNAKKAVAEIRTSLSGFPVAGVIFFAATCYDPDVLAKEMDMAFSPALTFGATSAGEETAGLVLKNSVVVMAYDASAFAFAAAVLVLGGNQRAENPDAFSNVDAAMERFVNLTGNKMLHLDYREYVGFVLGDAMSAFSEKLLERIGEVTNVNFCGGFAGDDYKFEAPLIFFRGRTYQQAAVVALWKPRNGFSLLKTQAVDLTGTTMMVTKADAEKSIIWELDGKPAADAYAQALGLRRQDLTVQVFDQHPLALIVNQDPYLRSGTRVVDDKGLQLLFSVKNGIRVTLCNAGDILASTIAALETMRKENPTIAGILHINCASRHNNLARLGQSEAFGALFRDVPNIGLSSYGEILVCVVAMTSTMIVFK